MCVFYAFCRVIDDVADDPGFSMEERREALNRWRKIVRGEENPLAGVEMEFVDLQQRYGLDQETLLEIVEGVEMDLEPLRFASQDELKDYCFRVASAVGLISIEIFGYTDPATRTYAEQLGYALQWTNILRDVGEDAEEGRVFLPVEDLARFGVSEQEILSRTPDRAKFERLMKYEASVSRAFYRAAMDALPAADRKSMRSAELMRRIYSGILDKMEEDRFHVFEKRYRLPKSRMLCEFLRAKFLG